MALPTFSFKQVEAILASTFEVDAAKRGTFSARLQQLQKMGLPQGSNSGRGRRVTYESWQLCEWQFYLDLLQGGIPPALIATRFRDLAFYSVDGDGRFGEACANAGRSYYTHVRFNALSYLETAGGSECEQGATSNSFTGGWNIDGVLRLANGKPGILIDLAKRLAKLKGAIAEVEPTLAGVDLFRHLPGELDG